MGTEPEHDRAEWIEKHKTTPAAELASALKGIQDVETYLPQFRGVVHELTALLSKPLESEDEQASAVAHAVWRLRRLSQIVASSAGDADQHAGNAARLLKRDQD